jgi:hypothetical protein
MTVFDLGDRVTVNAPGHRQDERSGTVVYHGKFFGTVGVEIGGSDYGFLPSELTKAED